MSERHADGVSCERRAVAEAVAPAEAVAGSVQALDGRPVVLAQDVLRLVGDEAGHGHHVGLRLVRQLARAAVERRRVDGLHERLVFAVIGVAVCGVAQLVVVLDAFDERRGGVAGVA